MRAIAAAVTILVLSSEAALAKSPYAGMQTRPIKGAVRAQIDDLKPPRKRPRRWLPNERLPRPFDVLENYADQLHCACSKENGFKTV